MSLNSFRTGLGNITSSPVGKWSLIAVGALLVFSLAFSWNMGGGLGGGGGAHGGSGGAAQTGDDVIATVNGDPVTRQDFEGGTQEMMSSPELMGRAIGVSEAPMVNNAVLERLINAKLQLQQAKTMNVAVSDAEIQKKRADILDASGLRQKLSLPPTASISDVDAALTKNGSSSIEDRLPDETLRQMILLGDPENRIPGKLMAAFSSGIVVTDANAQQFYTKYHTRHILISNKTRSDVQARAQAQQILAKAQAPGANFAALAKQYSDDPGTKARGGDDGFIGEDTQYIPEFKKAAFSLKPGAVTPDLVISPQYGYFIIKLDAVKADLPPDFAKNKAKYLADIQQQRAQEKYQEVMMALKNAAKIDVKDSALAGDRAFASAGQLGNPAQSQPKMQEALADYQKALKSNVTPTEKASVNAALGQIYQGLHQTPQAIAAYSAALAARDDSAMEMTLGNLYLQNKDNANAVLRFQKASLLAWNDENTHQQLQIAFMQAGHPELAMNEKQWLARYTKAHPAPTGPSGIPGMPPGMTGTVQPAGGIHMMPQRRPVKPTQ